MECRAEDSSDTETPGPDHCRSAGACSFRAKSYDASIKNASRNRTHVHRDNDDQVKLPLLMVDGKQSS